MTLFINQGNPAPRDLLPGGKASFTIDVDSDVPFSGLETIRVTFPPGVTFPQPGAVHYINEADGTNTDLPYQWDGRVLRFEHTVNLTPGAQRQNGFYSVDVQALQNAAPGDHVQQPDGLVIGLNTQAPLRFHVGTPPASGGIVHLSTTVDLQLTASGAWTNTGLEVTLPEAGTYQLDVDIRGQLDSVPPVNAFIVARLWNATSDTALPHSERLVSQIIDGNRGAAQYGKNATSPINERITVNAPTAIRLEVKRVNNFGTSTIAAGIYSDSDGYTSFRYQKVAP
ncbi:hypothetical protein [Kitasatospora sp. MAP5-34]|uniref:hypothetical protein n=1 Tax=Kitasatospora sp. MAP5-34 TaxID=3035102 RepID=UPI0024734BB4|nr:hypothetical protein [Kitasatospora sp. MAP5-34]MDH6574472.1 hypothetical protein [Kitasatospora sp. MAP5-34]